MRLSRRTNTIILWAISLGLLVGMVITFTPSLRNFGLNAQGNNQGAAALLVNGEQISELEVARLRQNRFFSSVTEGEVAEDLELLMFDTLIQQELLDQAAARVRVSGGEVRDAVDEFRESRGVAGSRNDQAYLNAIRSSGFTDETFRSYLREQLRQDKYRESLTEAVDVSDGEVAAFYETNQQRYQSEERIEARLIVVEDEALADEIRSRVEEGEAFADLAQEYSVERADRGGALGAPEGETEPQPVGRPALPTAVANAAFALRDPGLTEVIPLSGRYYLVSVEQLIPVSVRPFEEVEEEVREDALAAKRAAVVEATLEDLRDQAQITVPEEGLYQFSDQPIARVGDVEIMSTDLVRTVYSDPQIQQILSPDSASLVAQFFKPNVLEQLIERELAYQGASQLDASFIGTRNQVVSSALAYVSREATATDEAVQAYYDANLQRFTIPAVAEVTRVTFDADDQAMAFRDAVLAGTEPATAAEAFSGELIDLGTVREGQLELELDVALFATDGFEALPEGEDEVSDILVLLESIEQDAAENQGEQDVAEGEAEASNEETAEAEEVVTQREIYVVLVANRTPERQQSLEEVRATVDAAVLRTAEQELQDSWLQGLREEITVVNLMAEAARDAASFETTATAETSDAVVFENLEQAQQRSSELTEELRALVGRTDLGEEEQGRLLTLRSDLEEVQEQVAVLSGARGSYTVQEGDTLSAIAAAQYDDSGVWPKILEANSYLIDDEDLIFPGFVLLLPEIGEAEETD
ncbi:MAG: peptidyl-prolyl cis-trans isomerase [Trueperaceae bacterium]|nr:MAG: peptidyl-prolyl cis-trans isomerase [Trueperaceae bacterium]